MLWVERRRSGGGRKGRGGDDRPRDGWGRDLERVSGGDENGYVHSRTATYREVHTYPPLNPHKQTLTIHFTTKPSIQYLGRQYAPILTINHTSITYLPHLSPTSHISPISHKHPTPLPRDQPPAGTEKSINNLLPLPDRQTHNNPKNQEF
jgi:hypothetical protein